MKSSLSHVALLVPSAETSAKYLQTQGMQTQAPEIFDSEGTKEVYVGSYSDQRGLLLLLEAISEGPYKRAWAKRGASVHHISIDVLDLDSFLIHAIGFGWKSHEANATTIPKHQTAWLYLKGVPTLIEVTQKKEFASKPLKVSNLELPLLPGHMALFDGIGLGDLISASNEIRLTVEGRRLSFKDIASLSRS
jgi:hypothetical protein